MKPMRLLLTLASLLAPFAVAGQVQGGGTSSVAPAVNALGVDLYRIQASKGDGNILLSPYSIELALAMTCAGADGETKAEMQKVLHLAERDETVADRFAEFAGQVAMIAEKSKARVAKAKQSGGPSTPTEVTVANRLFVQSAFSLGRPFTTLLADRYRAPLQELDFRRSADKSREVINRWVEEQTRNKITGLIPPGGLTAETRVVLANAVYLRAAWENEFFDRATSSERFYVKGSESANVPTMIQTAWYGYAKQDGFTTVNMPYEGGEFSFLILLPDAPDGLSALEKEITPELLAKEGKSPRQEVTLHLPKFRIEPPTIPLAEHLQELGMKSAFDQPPGSANFDRMAPRKPGDYLRISQVFHKAYLALDEKGTEAAAATAVALAPAAAVGERKVPPVVRVDHPFLFAIQHVPSGTCLFLGRVTDPR
jgi:serpin B